MAITDVSMLEANGRVSEFRKLPLQLSITNGVLRVANADGFCADITIPSNGSCGYTQISPENVQCQLGGDNGARISLEGRYDPSSDFIRLDASDQENHYWFWLEVRRNPFATMRRSKSSSSQPARRSERLASNVNNSRSNSAV